MTTTQNAEFTRGDVVAFSGSATATVVGYHRGGCWIVRDVTYRSSGVPVDMPGLIHRAAPTA